MLQVFNACYHNKNYVHNYYNVLDFEAALKAETEKRKQLEARLEQLETEKERVASVAQKRISDLNDANWRKMREGKTAFLDSVLR